MKKESINKEAFGYVKLHVYVPVSEEEFITIEKYVAQIHDSLYPNGSYGDVDLENFVHQKLTEENIFIKQSKVDAIINALYDYMRKEGYLLPIDWAGKFDKWCDWKQTLLEARREFILFYKDEYKPDIVIMSDYTRSQIEFISELTDNSDYKEIKTLLKFQIDNSLSDKCFILLYSLDDDDDDDDKDKPRVKSPIDEISINFNR